MTSRTVAAVDRGAESGRVAAVEFDGARLSMRVQRRFDTGVAEVEGRLRWKVDALWAEIATGLGELGAGREVTSVGVDAWGLDYGYFDARGTLIEQPVAYRDPHHRAADDRAIAQVGASRCMGQRASS